MKEKKCFRIRRMNCTVKIFQLFLFSLSLLPHEHAVILFMIAVFFAFYSYLRCAIHLMSTQCSFAWSKSELKLKNKSVKWDKGKSTCKYLPLTVVHILTFNFDFESVFLFPPFLYGFSSQSLSLSLIYDQLFTVRCFPNCFWVNYHAQQMVFWPPIQVQ